MSIFMLQGNDLIRPKEKGIELTEEMLSWPLYYVDDCENGLRTECFRRILKVLINFKDFDIRFHISPIYERKELYTSGFCCFVVLFDDQVVYVFPKDTKGKFNEEWSEAELKEFFLNQIGK